MTDLALLSVYDCANDDAPDCRAWFQRAVDAQARSIVLSTFTASRDEVTSRTWIHATGQFEYQAGLAVWGHAETVWGGSDFPGRLIFGGVARLLSDHGDQQAQGSHLMPVAYAVDGSERDNLDAWYLEEHLDLLLRAPYWLRSRRYERIDGVGTPWTRIILHDLAVATVMQRPEIRSAISTEWRERLAQRPWFLEGGRQVYSRTA